MLSYEMNLSTSPLPVADRARILESPGYGKYFSDHIVTAQWRVASGWQDAQIRPYGTLPLAPAAAILHYGQAIFEGLKAYRHSDGSIWTFRPHENAGRFQRSARRLALPELPVEDFMSSLHALVEVDRDWVPATTESSLYLRPFMFASEPYLGNRPANEVTYCVVASPAGAYFPNGAQPISIWVSNEFVRAAPGGTGAAKFGGNYAASLAAQVDAAEHGCDQVCFLDVIERRWVEELGGMNVYAVFNDNSIVTPELSGTILEGITRASIIDLASDAGYSVSERKLDINELFDGAKSGSLREVFACGTAAVVNPIGRLVSSSADASINGGVIGPVTMHLRRALLDIQYGIAPDPRGWMFKLI